MQPAYGIQYGMQRIISWNVNGIRAAHKKGLLDFVRNDSPDILCLQETKAEYDQLPAELQEAAGYKNYYASAQRKGYSGVSIWSREEPAEISIMNVSEFDAEGRVLCATYDRRTPLTVINAYFPNSQEKGKRLDFKLAFCQAILELCNDLNDKNHELVLCGDYNIAHTEIDLANPRQNTENPGFLPEEREWMSNFLGAGYIDTFREFTQEGGHYSWWSYRSNARARNIGWRIDYHCINPLLKAKLESAAILPHVLGSDHCPVSLTLNH